MKSSICFVALKGYAVLSGNSSVRHIGGAEVQQALVARGLSARGHQIRFVTLDHGQPDAEDLDGIRVYRSYRWDAGRRGVRFVHPRATSVWRAMGRADADVYYQRTSDSLTGIVAAYCRWRRRGFVFGVGALGDCQPELPFCPSRRERVLYRYGLKAADAVVAQTVGQQTLLRAHFGVDSILVPSCGAAPTRTAPPPEGRPRMLWIGRLSPEKRFDLLLDVADRCPEIAFDVVGDGHPSDAVLALKSRASRVHNVTMHGYVPHSRVSEMYERGTALINTSVLEGFPNTFLEAWSRGIPVVTTFDPDDVVAKHDLGLCGDTAEALGRAVRSMCLDRGVRSRCGDNAIAYFRSHHTVAAATDAYERLFTRLSRGPSRLPGWVGHEVSRGEV